jgi:two-component system sensor histidine kinase UhpB
MLREEAQQVASPPLDGGRRSRARPRQAAIEADVRRLVARELHDRVAQTLTGMLVDLENFKSEPVDWQDVLRQVDLVQDSTRQVLNNLRQLLHDLRGEQGVGDSFVEAVGVLVARFEDKTQIKSKLSVDPAWPTSLTPPAAVNLYRIIEEALANVRMHSGAREVRVILQPSSDSELSVVVGDDGRGVDTVQSRPVGMGTVGMKERALLLGGVLQIESQNGDGTIVRAIFPKDQLTPTKGSEAFKSHFTSKEKSA